MLAYHMCKPISLSPSLSLSVFLSLCLPLSLLLFVSLCLSVSISLSLSLSLYIYIYIYIYEEGEEERDKERDRERGKERTRDREREGEIKKPPPSISHLLLSPRVLGTPRTQDSTRPTWINIEEDKKGEEKRSTLLWLPQFSPALDREVLKSKKEDLFSH